jgi:hypothetical protein
MPTTVEFSVPARALETAVRASGDALRGRGFTVVVDPYGDLLATRGSRFLTILLGSLVPAGRHYLRFAIEATAVDDETASIRLVEREHGVAVGDGPAGDSRRGRARRWAADGIEAALVASGVLLRRIDRD